MAVRLSRRALKAWHERALVLKALSFALVGLVNSAVDFGVFSFAYYYLALPIITANVAAWFVAVSGSYVMNSLTTFAREVRPRADAEGLCGICGLAARGARRQHRDGAGRVVFHAGAGRQAAGDRGELPGQLLALAFPGVSQAAGRRAGRALGLDPTRQSASKGPFPQAGKGLN